MYTPETNNVIDKGPVKAMFICLIIGWIFFFIPIPFISFLLALIFIITTIVLAIVCISKGSAGKGILGIIAAVAGSIIVYFISWLFYGALIVSSVQSTVKTSQNSYISINESITYGQKQTVANKTTSSVTIQNA